MFLSQGLAMLTAKMFAVQMKEFKFVFSQMAFIQTILYFAIIFIIVMIFNGITISKYKLINLLNSAKKNQKTRLKNPILSVILFLISIGILGIAYHLIQKNQMLAVDNDFKISVLLGVAGIIALCLTATGDMNVGGSQISIFSLLIRPEVTNTPHTAFELWRAGNPLNPENFIKFK